MKANHNQKLYDPETGKTVSNGSKILKWKQITTRPYTYILCRNCFQWFKDTKMKANHNRYLIFETLLETVSNGSKILKWKQITTFRLELFPFVDCFQWFKDTKMKANHNLWPVNAQNAIDCFQWFKDTKMKANHNLLLDITTSYWTVSNGSKILKWKQITTREVGITLTEELFPMVQRY